MTISLMHRFRSAIAIGSFLLAVPGIAGAFAQVLVTPFANTPGATTAASARFETRLIEQLTRDAGERASVRAIAARSHSGSFEAHEVRDLAAAQGAGYVVVGSWLSAASDARVIADLELRSGHSGGIGHRYRVDLGTGDSSIDEEVRRVSALLLQDVEENHLATGPPPVSGPAETATGSGAQKSDRKRTDFLRVSRDEPIEINSEELELIARGNSKHLIFTQEVKVIQGDMHLYAGRIEAIYPNGASQPDRLNASRSVRVTEGDLEVHCREATYLRNDQIVICRGEALLVQGCDEVRGDEIEFRIGEERVKVNGAASVVLRFDLEDSTSCHDRSTAG